MDHSQDAAPIDGPWAGGWVVAALADSAQDHGPASDHH